MPADTQIRILVVYARNDPEPAQARREIRNRCARDIKGANVACSVGVVAGLLVRRQIVAIGFLVGIQDVPLHLAATVILRWPLLVASNERSTGVV